MGFFITSRCAPAADAAPPAPAAPASAPTTQDEAAAELAKQRQEREEERQRLPKIQVGSLRDVVQLSVENEDVVLRTSIPPTEHSAVVVEGDKSYITVSAARGEGGGSPYVPSLFRLIRTEFPEPGGNAITHVNVISLRVHISKTSEVGEEFRNVDFIQSNEFLEEGDDRVRFYVQERRGEEEITNLKLGAVNVLELRRKYPAETMRYLEPIFRDFGQASALFHVNTRAAWQVLGGSSAPPADVVKQVDALLVRLDAQDPQDRAAAMAELEKLGQPAALALMKRDRKGLSEEQQTRIETFLATFKPLSDEEAAAMRADPEFLLLALSADDPALAELALARLKEVAKQPIAFDLKATGQARADAIAKLRAQLLPATTRPATTRASLQQPRETPQ